MNKMNDIDIGIFKDGGTIIRKIILFSKDNYFIDIFTNIL